MTAFSVDSEAVLTATGAIRATADRLQSETAAMLGQLTQLQGAWTGSAAVAFQG
jgi:WXG100 family type VII secretion target